MVDIGLLKGKQKKEDFKTVKYLSELKPGDELTGEPELTKINTKTINRRGQEKEVNEFYLIVKDKKNLEKWVLGIISTVYFDEDGVKIYGERGGRVYILIDTISHVLNNTPRNKEEEHKVYYDTLKELINERGESMTLKAVEAGSSKATTPNLEVTKLTLFDEY